MSDGEMMLSNKNKDVASTEVEQIRSALQLWANNKMSTAELFRQVGLEWDGSRMHSLFSKLWIEIIEAKEADHGRL